MNSNEEFKIKLIYEISSNLNLNFYDQQRITDTLTTILVDYEVNKRVTDLVVSDITEKIVMFLQAKKIEGMSPNTIQNYFYTKKSAISAFLESYQIYYLQLLFYSSYQDA